MPVVRMKEKICPNCKRLLSRAMFGEFRVENPKSGAVKMRMNSWCKECARGRARTNWRKSKSIRNDGGLCQICGLEFEDGDDISKRSCGKCLETMRHRSRVVRLDMMKVYSKGEMKCACCGETRDQMLTLDHIHGGGTKHREQGYKGAKLFWHLKKLGWPEGYRVLCQNCNHAMGHYGYCPCQVDGKSGLGPLTDDQQKRYEEWKRSLTYWMEHPTSKK